MLKNIPKPAIIGHRGASAHAPENTLEAFELALEQGADGIELDVKLSADGIPVVIHDPSVDRTTDGKGLVHDLSLAALKELDAGNGQKIPTLAEVFDSVGGKLLINIELTNYTTRNDQLVEKVVEVIKKHNLADGILFSSFLPKNLKRAEKLLPKTPRGLLAIPRPLGFFARTFGFRSSLYQAVHPSIKNVTEKMIAQANQRKQQIIVWTVNTPDEMQKLSAWGTDGIITDDPALAVRTLR